MSKEREIIARNNTCTVDAAVSNNDADTHTSTLTQEDEHGVLPPAWLFVGDVESQTHTGPPVEVVEVLEGHEREGSEEQGNDPHPDHHVLHQSLVHAPHSVVRDDHGEAVQGDDCAGGSDARVRCDGAVRHEGEAGVRGRLLSVRRRERTKRVG